jgi:hypothetical protein
MSALAIIMVSVIMTVVIVKIGEKSTEKDIRTV